MSLNGPDYGPSLAWRAITGQWVPAPTQSQLDERNEFLRTGRGRLANRIGDYLLAHPMPRRPSGYVTYPYRFGGGAMRFEPTLTTYKTGKVNGYKLFKKAYSRYKKRKRGALVSRSAFRNLPSELKVNDVSFGSYATNTASAVPLLLNGIATGTDYNTRVGRQAWVKSIDYRIAVYPEATQAVPGGWIRYIIFCDEQPNGTAPIWTDLIASSDVAQYNNLNNRDRFTILRDQFVNIAQVDLSATGAGLNGKQKFFKKGRIIPKVGVTTYNGTGSTYTSINTCALWFIVVSDQTTNTVTCNARFRVRFVDE